MNKNASRLALAASVALPLTACPNPEAVRTCVPEAGTICTIAGIEAAGIDGDGGPGWAARLYLPMDAELGPDGRLYIVDWNNHRIRSMMLDGNYDGVIETFAGSGVLGDGPVGPATAAAFNHPTNLTFDGEGNVYIAAWHNSRIRRCNVATGMMEPVAGTGARAYIGDGGPAEMAAMDLPAGIAFDPDGNLVVVDQANQVIRRIDMTAHTIERVAGTCITTAPCMDGESPVACMGTNKSACVTTDPAGCGLPCAPAYGGDDGPALEARFAMPFGQSADPSGRIAIDAEGNIYFADSRNHRVRMISTDGTIVTIAGSGNRNDPPGEGGPATAAGLDNPVDVELGPDGSLYIADTMNSCIRRVDAGGIIHTVAGVCGERGFEGDGGSPTEALLDRPYGIDIDEGGVLYISDTHNHRVRVVIPGE